MGTNRGLFRYGDNPDGVRYDLLPQQLRRGVIGIYPFTGNRLLVRTQDGNYSVFNPEDNTLDTDFNACLQDWGVDLPVNWDLRVRTDRSGTVWLFSADKLYRKTPSDVKAALMTDVRGAIRNLDWNGKECCVITDSLAYVLPMDGTEHILAFPHGIHFHRPGVWTAIDDEGNLWIGSEDLYRFDRKTLERKCLEKDISVMDIIHSQSGDILVATGTSGILLYGKDGGLRQRIAHEPFDSGSLASNNVMELRESTDGTLWVGFNKPVVSVCQPGGIASLTKHILPLQQSGLEENVISMAEAPDGSVWFGTDGHGLFRRDSRSGAFIVPGIHPTKPAVTSLFFDSKGRTWAGTYLGGIYCMDKGKSRHFLPNSSCFSLVEDHDGNIWAGMQGDGIYRIPLSPERPPQPVSISFNPWIYQLAQTGGTLYAVGSNGLAVIDQAGMKATPVKGNRSGSQTFQNGHFTSAVADSRGLLWLAGNRSDTPLEIYDTRRDTIMYLPQLSGHIVKGIVEDDNRNIWLSTESLLAQIIINYDSSRQHYIFQPSLYQIRSQESSPSYNNARSAVRLSDGTLLFGGTAGYLRIPAGSYPPHSPLPSPPALSITALMIDGEYIGTGARHNGHVVLEKDITTLTGITLDHTENDISLIISAQNYTAPMETSLHYRIRNWETDWKPVRGSIIDLNRLSPGHYNLEVSNGFPDGSLTGEILPFSITILPPWYATGWAMTLYLLLLSGGIAFLVHHYKNRQREKQSLKQIREEANRQQQLNEMKLRFFTNISHDFRTPLTLIITPLETYLNDEAHKGEESFLRPIYRNAVRLLNLVNQILDFRKLEADSVSLHLTYGDLVPFLRDICSSFTLFADETGKRLEFLPEKEEIATAFDKDKLSKIVMNLLSNAFKYTPENGEVTLRVHEEEGSAVISVADNGPGVSDAQKEAIFERFYQVKDHMTSYVGSGIGLHIVREFTRLHGGTVLVTDNQPSGAVFTVRIPLRGKVEEIPASVQKAALEEQSGQNIDTPAGKKLLIVEDNTDFRKFLKEQLSGEYTVFTATDGRAALEVLEKDDIDLIISDIMMEGMDGLALCKAVKSNLTTSHIPVILLTAKAMAEDEIRGLEMGADDYVTKPFHMQILRLRIRKLLEEHLQAQRKFSEKMDVVPSEITITSLDEQFLSKAIRITEENMENPDFSVEMLSAHLGMHRTHLYKKLMSLTGKKPVEFIRTIRLKRAAQYLLKSQLYVSEIAYRVGFNSPKLFSRHFREEFGMTPREYQQKNAGL